MESAVVTESGDVSLQERAAPRPAAGEALVRVEAAALTRGEAAWPEGRFPAVPSYEVAGTVAALGPGTSAVAVGDQVYALLPFDRDGAAADLAAIAVELLAPRPHAVDAVRAAALPLAGLSAWQGLYVHGGLEHGQRVLVTGPTGGVGHLAVQLARWTGADVVDANDSDQGRRLDLVFDTSGPDSWSGVRAERVVTIVDEHPGATFFVVEPDREQLGEIARLTDQGVLRPQVDSTFPLAQVSAAFARLAEHGKHGKVVLRLDAQVG